MGKCSALWTGAGKPNSGKITQEHRNRQLKYPCPTGGNAHTLGCIFFLKNVNKKFSTCFLKLPFFHFLPILVLL